MRTIRSWLVVVGAGLLVACGGGGGDAGAPPTVPVVTASVAVTVADTLGRFVDAATVTVASTGATATTSATGKATLQVPVGSEQVLVLAKSGFAEQVRLLTLAAGATQGSLTALMVAREPAQAIASIEAGGSAGGKDGVKVTFPPGALVDAAGQPVSGTIQMSMTPLNTARSDIGAFPGAFEGTAPGVARSAIVTLGTSELVPQQNGQKLQLARGKTATIELPMYASAQLDGTAIRVGDTVPLWSLNTATGLWVQEGQGIVIAQPASPTGLALRASIGHFSWWNIDQFAQRATVNVTVVAPGNTVPANTAATLEARVLSGTGPASTGSTGVIVGTPQALTVAGPATLSFTARFDLGNLTCNGSTSAGVTPGATTNVTVSATCVQVPVPTIVVPAALSATNSRSPTRVQIELAGPQPDSVQLLANGNVVATFGPQFFYIDLLDTAGLPEGSTTLQAVATVGTSTRSSNTVELVIDRTPPRATSVSPDAAVEVGRGTTFTVTFDEPVNPLPFTLSDAVKFTVTPIGQTTPVPVGADISLDTAGLTLTVTPRVDLPAGVVGLSWGALQDAAGNPITGTIAATWNVDRSSFVGPALSHVEDGADFMGAALAFNIDGSLLAAHKPVPGTALTLSRFDSTTNTWVVLASAVNDRPTQDMLALAVDGNGVPYVAFVQQTAASASAWELVLKRFNGTAMESAAPAVPLLGARGFDVNQGSMAIDGSNRPVITFTDPNVSNIQLFRLEQGALVSMAAMPTLAFDPHLALQADGTPVVAYIQGFGGSNAGALRVARVVNGVVQQLGATIDSVGDATQQIGSPRVLMRGTEPWAFWVKNGFVNAARFDGTNWISQPFGTPVDGGFAIDVALFGGDPILAASRVNGMQVLRFHAGAWDAGFDATARGDHQDRIELAVHGTDAAVISSSIFRSEADVQRLLFP